MKQKVKSWHEIVPELRSAQEFEHLHSLNLYDNFTFLLSASHAQKDVLHGWLGEQYDPQPHCCPLAHGACNGEHFFHAERAILKYAPESEGGVYAFLYEELAGYAPSANAAISFIRHEAAEVEHFLTDHVLEVADKLTEMAVEFVTPNPLARFRPVGG